VHSFSSYTNLNSVVPANSNREIIKPLVAHQFICVT